MLSLCRLATVGVPPRSLAGPRHHRNVTVRVVPPPRRLAARGVDPPRQRAGGWSPRCRRSEQEPPYAIALPGGGGLGRGVVVVARCPASTTHPPPPPLPPHYT